MKIISFDVGIKNMAYCCLSCDSTSVLIDDWGILDLLNTETTQHLCNYEIPPKTKKQTSKICNKKAKYKKGDKCFCEKHAKMSSFLIPNKKTATSFIKKQKIDTLLGICKGHFLFFEGKPKKDEIVEKLDNFYKQKCLETISQTKRLASEIDLIEIGRNMKHKLNELSLSEITHVIIENQISPLANRMKTIQGMLAQYFIMVNENIEISFVSSANKLKQFEKITLENEFIPDDQNTNLPKNNPNYKQNKKGGVYYCKQILDANEQFVSWTDKMNISKKDDLADSFLQGLWHFNHNKLISYAENLKIKIV